MKKKIFKKAGFANDQRGIAACIFGALVPLLVIAIVGLVFVGVGWGLNPNKPKDEGGTVIGNVDFLVTTYDPMLGGDNGDLTASAGKIAVNDKSPTGFVTQTFDGRSWTAGIAVPQDSTHHRNGVVDIKKIPVPLLHDPKKDYKKGIIIPGYNDNKPAPVFDHYATSITEPNSVDLLCRHTPKGCSDQLYWYWDKNKIPHSSGHNGYSSAEKVKGKVVDISSISGQKVSWIKVFNIFLDVRNSL